MEEYYAQELALDAAKETGDESLLAGPGARRIISTRAVHGLRVICSLN